MTSANFPWLRVPDHIKRQAAPDMLAGKRWNWIGCEIERPSDEELMKWASPDSVADKVKEAAPSPAQTLSSRMNRMQKRCAVDAMLAGRPNLSAREIARETGTSHRFVSLRRRLMSGNVAMG